MQKFREMSLNDVVAVHRIEKHAHVAPWNQQTIKNCIEVGYPGFILEQTNESKTQLIGYIIFRYDQKQCHILNLCIAKDQQGKGHGRKMMLYVLEKLRHIDCREILLEVRPTNQTAINLYLSLGFQKVGIKKGYYQDVETFEDALVFQKAL